MTDLQNPNFKLINMVKYSCIFIRRLIYIKSDHSDAVLRNLCKLCFRIMNKLSFKYYHWIIYIRTHRMIKRVVFNFLHHWVDTSAGGQSVPEGIISSVLT